ncbi:hypothetical protein [Streptomyces cellulosae]|uniref:hypothetical protein n=1 Tax=Streptomyces cellulosae TaxID=1968 RepID=UPI001F47EBB4|nr:hypothetical protein [Streptomyces cellulosae]
MRGEASRRCRDPDSDLVPDSRNYMWDNHSDTATRRNDHDHDRGRGGGPHRGSALR